MSYLEEKSVRIHPDIEEDLRMPVWVLFMNLCRLLLAPLLDAHRPRHGLRNARLMEFVKQHKVWYCWARESRGISTV